MLSVLVTLLPVVVLLLLQITGTQAAAALTFRHYCSHDIAGENAIAPLVLPANASFGSVSLLQVHVLLRHGARTPWNPHGCWSGYNQSWTCNVRENVSPFLWNQTTSTGSQSQRTFQKVYEKGLNVLQGNCAKGQLLDEGFAQEVQNGVHFRTAYVGDSATHLFRSSETIDLVNISDFHLESDDEMRTVMSGQVFLDAMFPPTDADVATDSPVTWQVGDIETSPYEESYGQQCPRIAAVTSAWKNSDDFSSWKNSAEHQQLDSQLEQQLGVYQKEGLYDCVMTATCAGFPVPISDDLVEAVAVRYEETQRRMYMHNNSLIAQLAVAKVTQRILSHVQDLNATSTTPRFALYSGHDSTLAPFLAAVGGAAWYPAEWIPYAAYITIEIYSASNSSEPMFRVLYQGRPLPISGCDQVLCPLSWLLRATQFAHSDLQCEADADKASVLPVLSTQSWLAVSGLALVLGVLAGIVIMCCVAKRTDARKDGKSSRHLLRKDGTADDADTCSEGDVDSDAGTSPSSSIEDSKDDDDEMEVINMNLKSVV